MPRFVVLEHDHPQLHWDFMLETGPVLRTWRLAAAPAPGIDIAALAIGDHRLAYLDYEGPLSGDRGAVRRHDAGDYQIVEETSSSLILALCGKKIVGHAALQRVASGQWVFRLVA